MKGISCDFAARRAIELHTGIGLGFVLADVDSHVAFAVGVEPHGLGRVARTLGMQVAGSVRLNLQDDRSLNFGWDSEASFRSDHRQGAILRRD
jgi:hypothetical protein